MSSKHQAPTSIRILLLCDENKEKTRRRTLKIRFGGCLELELWNLKLFIAGEINFLFMPDIFWGP